MEGLINSINNFNDFGVNYQHLQQLNLNEDILREYKQLVDNIMRNLANTQELHGYFVLLYTESFFDALNNIQMYRQHIPNNIFNYDRFINALVLDNNYYTAISHEGGGLVNSNRQSGSHLPATLADGRAYSRNTLPVVGDGQPLFYQSLCEERPPDSPDNSFNLQNNIIDGYSTYAANLIKKEFVELRQGEELNIINMVINNAKFFNKIALLTNANNTILDNNFFNLTRERLENNRDLQFYRDPQLLEEMIRSFDVGIQPNDPAHWGVSMNSTITYTPGARDLGIVNSHVWIANIKAGSQFNNLPDNFLTDHIEYGSVFLNAFQRNTTAWQIYIPLLRTGFSSDLSNNSTISYSHKFSHELFAGGYQTLGFGPLFFDTQQQIIFYNHDLLNTFSLNYRSSTVINRLIGEIQRVDANHINAMTNNPNHDSWRNFYNHLMERFHSIIKSVELVCNIGTGIGNNINGILPLIHKLPLFHGSNINLFGELGNENEYTYTRAFLSCTTNIDTAFRFTNNDGITYIYLILIESGEHCPFINMGNFFREFTIAPGTILHRLGSFRLPDLNWTAPYEKLGNQVEYVLVRPAIGNFVAELTNLIQVANTWEPYLRSRTCFHNHANVFNQNANIAQSIDGLRNNVLTRIPPNNIQIGGVKKRKKNKNANLLKKMRHDLLPVKDIFKIPKVKRMYFSLSPNSNTLKTKRKRLSALKKRELADEHSHFNSFANNKLFETFKTKDKLIKYIVEINNGFNDNIKNLKKNLSKKQENNKDTLIKSKSNKKLAFKLIETNPKYVLNEETLKILNLKKF